MRVGSRTFRKLGVPRFNWGDLYHQLLTISWPLFLELICLAYTASNALFALAYLADPHGIVNARPSIFSALAFAKCTSARTGPSFAVLLRT
jgi:inward rectifier potassium channel